MTEPINTILRAPTDADIPFLVALRNNHALQARLMALPRASTTERVREWLARLLSDPNGVFFIVAQKETGAAVGYVQLGHMDFVHGHAELGIAIGEGFQGQGFGREALYLLEQYALRTFGLRKVHLKVLATNAPAIRLYNRTGYTVVGTMRKHFYHDGSHKDVVIMEKFLERVS